MRVIETLTDSQKRTMLIDRVPVGIFPYIILETDPFYDMSIDLCIGYYIGRSGSKTVSPLYTRMKQFEKDVEPNIDDPNEIIGSIIRTKFLNNWNKIYDLLVTKEYDALNNIDITETKTGNNSDTTTFDTSIEDNGETGTHEEITTTEQVADDSYGFNSTSPVGNTFSSSGTTEVVTGDANKNTNHNIQAKTGTESKVFGIDEETTKSGRWYGNPTEAVDAEIKMRVMLNFSDIVYRDIDSVFTCPLYE